MADTPRPLQVYGVPLGADFPAAVVNALRQEYSDQPPDALARVELIVNTRRMARRIRALFDSGPPCLLPRISLVADFAETQALMDVPQPVPPLRRRLELVQLVDRLLEAEPDLAPRANLYSLADSLAGLMDEMQAQGVHPTDIEHIDISDQSGHWARILTFLSIVRPFFDLDTGPPDRECRQRLVIERLSRIWDETPPDHPVILAGSTGSRAPTQLLMQTVARLPMGKVILPGFDFDQPRDVWDQLIEHGAVEDHPQFRFADLMSRLGAHPKDVLRWPECRPANPACNRLVSLALRPAPVTDQWLRDGPSLEAEIVDATKHITLLEAPSPRTEAVSIALRLRQAVEDGATAAMISTDRTLTRQVTAALDRWNIVPDDSAGIPLQQSAPGRFMRHIADLFRAPATTEQLFTLLKHPLTHSGADRGPHLRYTRELELYLRQRGCPVPSPDIMRDWAISQDEEQAQNWGEWVCENLLNNRSSNPKLVSDRIARHIALAEAISQGQSPDVRGRLWDGEAGEETHKTVSNLAEHASASGALNATDYAHLFHAILSQESVRSADAPHQQVLIWGTLEARVQGADLLILAGLNEGSWPEMPPQDPWLNRAMRKQVGLTLPERRIGLSAHDFQQAICAHDVWLTRSVRSEDAQTVPSRWLNRLQNLICGLSAGEGQQAFEDMRSRGQDWLVRANKLEQPEDTPLASRPAPCPPSKYRPRKLSVTDIKRLIRDPYAIYARHVLRLRPLNSLMRVPDALLRGTVLHEVFEMFIRDSASSPDLFTPKYLQDITARVLEEKVHWAEAKALWRARINRVTDWFIETEVQRRAEAHPTAFETLGSADIPALGFTLTAKADRIDIGPDGGLYIYDYKTGTAPTKPEQLHFDKQLLLEAAIAERAGFAEILPAPVVQASYIALGNKPAQSPAPLEDEPPNDTWSKLNQLIARYLQDDQGFVSRRAVQKTDEIGDYDHLARFGEWEQVDDPNPEEVG
ncbi:double-strand break repair protein AddB [Roseovarius phycicola]|uniref:Double-strand break repair protein AddB n=1 Tax=Roseovarius phycicola TaxID=3080976 RepID=A0ABZ2HHQ2_9RHOB